MNNVQCKWFEYVSWMNDWLEDYTYEIHDIKVSQFGFLVIYSLPEKPEEPYEGTPTSEL